MVQTRKRNDWVLRVHLSMPVAPVISLTVTKPSGQGAHCSKRWVSLPVFHVPRGQGTQRIMLELNCSPGPHTTLTHRHSILTSMSQLFFSWIVGPKKQHRIACLLLLVGHNHAAIVLLHFQEDECMLSNLNALRKMNVCMMYFESKGFRNSKPFFMT